MYRILSAPPQHQPTITPLTWVCIGVFAIGLFIAWKVMR